MNSKCLSVVMLLLASAALGGAAERAGIGMYVWSPDQEGALREKTRMRLIVETATGGPIVLLRDFAGGTKIQLVVEELVAALRGAGLAASHRSVSDGRALLMVEGARALRVSYSPSTVYTELADSRGLESLPALVASD